MSSISGRGVFRRPKRHVWDKKLEITLRALWCPRPGHSVHRKYGQHHLSRCPALARRHDMKATSYLGNRTLIPKDQGLLYQRQIGCKVAKNLNFRQTRKSLHTLTRVVYQIGLQRSSHKKVIRWKSWFWGFQCFGLCFFCHPYFSRLPHYHLMTRQTML